MRKVLMVLFGMYLCAPAFAGLVTEDSVTGKKIATPSNPNSGYDKMYFKSDDNLYKLTPGGVESQVGSPSYWAISGTSTDIYNTNAGTVELKHSAKVTPDDPANPFTFYINNTYGWVNIEGGVSGVNLNVQSPGVPSDHLPSAILVSDTADYTGNYAFLMANLNSEHVVDLEAYNGTTRAGIPLIINRDGGGVVVGQNIDYFGVPIANNYNLSVVGGLASQTIYDTNATNSTGGLVSENPTGVSIFYTYGAGTATGTEAFRRDSMLIDHFTWASNGAGMSFVEEDPTGYMTFFTGGSADANERMRITADGNIQFIHNQVNMVIGDDTLCELNILPPTETTPGVVSSATVLMDTKPGTDGNWLACGLNLIDANVSNIFSINSATFAGLPLRINEFGGNVSVNNMDSLAQFSVEGPDIAQQYESVAFFYEKGADLSGSGLVSGYPCVLTLQSKDANNYYQLGYKSDSGSIANYLSGGALVFDYYDTSDNWAYTNMFPLGGGFVYNGTGDEAFLGIYHYAAKQIGIGDTATPPIVLVDTATGHVGIGTSTPNALLTLTNNVTGLPTPPAGVVLNMVAADGAGTASLMTAYGSIAQNRMKRANGTAASPTALVTDNSIGLFNWGGYDGSAFSGAQASIGASSEANWATTSRPTYLTLSTTSVSSTTNSERVRIASNGNVGIGTTSPTAKLQVSQGTTGPGTVTTIAGLGAISGTGTQFTNTFKPGDSITINGETKSIGVVNSDVLMTTSAFTNSNTDVAYTLPGRTVLSAYGNGNINIPGLTASKTIFTDASQNLTSTGIGTSGQFIKGDGSLDSSTYLTSLSGALLATGATTGATSQAQTFTNGVITGKVYPSANSATAFQITKADATTVVWNVDTTNSRIGVGTTAPGEKEEIYNGNLLLNESNLKFTGEATPAAPSLALVNTSTGNCTNGTHIAKVTMVTAQGETDASVASNTVTVDASNKQITITLPTGTVGVVTGRNIYVTSAGTTTYYRVSSGVSVADNTTTSYVFNLADASITGNLTAGSGLMNTTTGQIYSGGTSRWHIDPTTGYLTTGLSNVIQATSNNISYGSIIMPTVTTSNRTVVVSPNLGLSGWMHPGNSTLPLQLGGGNMSSASNPSGAQLSLGGSTAASVASFYNSGNLAEKVAIGTNVASGMLDVAGPQNFANIIDPPVACSAGTATSGGSINTGTHSWKYTFVNGAGESLPSAKSNVKTIAASNYTIPLTAILAGPIGTTSRKVYRTQAGDAGSYYYVATIADNTTTTYTDTASDATIGANPVAPSSNTTAVGNIQVAGTTFLTISSAGGITVPSTITTPGTTGNQTINKAAGRVNIAAAGTTVTVTNSLVTANSIVIAVAATADATARVTNVVPAAGSFVINTVACTAETAFNFWVVS